MTPLRCPGGAEWRTANLARRAAWAREADPTRRMVPAECDGHYHLKPRETAPTNDTKEN